MILRKMMLAEEDVAEEAIPDAENFHFGTLSMTHEGVRKATKRQYPLQRKKVLLYPLIRICVHHFGSPWK